MSKFRDICFLLSTLEDLTIVIEFGGHLSTGLHGTHGGLMEISLG